MNFEDLYSLVKNNLYVDLILILKDDQNETEIVINLHKNILFSNCIYFKKLLTSCKEKILNKIYIKVPNVYVAHDIIMSFYKHDVNKGNLPKWKHVLESIKCYDYFGLEFNIRQLLHNLDIPEEGFELLLEVINLIEIEEDFLCYLVHKNLPKKYDLSNLSKKLINKIITIERSYRLICSDYDKIVMFNIFTGIPIMALTGHIDQINYICLSYDGVHIASVGSDHKIKIWNTGKGHLVKTINYGSVQNINKICFSPSGHKLVSVIYNRNFDAIVGVWNVKSGNCMQAKIMKCCTNGFCFSSDGSLIYLAYGNDITYMDITTGVSKYKFGLAYLIDCICMSSDYKSIIIGSAGKISIHDIDSGLMIRACDDIKNLLNVIIEIICSPDNLRIVSRYINNQIIVWDAKTCLLVCSFTCTSTINCVCYSPDNLHIVICSSDKSILIFNSEQGNIVRSFNMFNKPGFSTCFCPGFSNDMLHTWFQNNNDKINNNKKINNI